MALSIEELERQSTEYLPSREVLTTMGGGPARHDGHLVDGPSDNTFAGGVLNGINVQDVLSDWDVRDVQVGLVNVSVHDVQDLVDVASANYDDISRLG